MPDSVVRRAEVRRAVASPKEMFGSVVQIGVVVKDLDHTVQVLQDVFGMGPFRTIDWPPADRSDMQRFYHGQPADFTARMAFAELGAVELELIQPVSGASIWADFLRDRGEGIHHIRFNTYDMAPVIEHLSAAAGQMLPTPELSSAYRGTYGAAGPLATSMRLSPQRIN